MEICDWFFEFANYRLENRDGKLITFDEQCNNEYCEFDKSDIIAVIERAYLYLEEEVIEIGIELKDKEYQKFAQNKIDILLKYYEFDNLGKISIEWRK